MATYKKSGSKAKGTKRERTVAQEQSATAEVFNTLDESASRSEAWVLKNQKAIFGLVGLIVVAMIAYLGYNKYVAAPGEKAAADELAFPRKHFNQALTSSVAADSLYTLALDGADGKYGFVDIADEYAGTDAGNLANYYAGISYLALNEYEQAISYLENFSSDDANLGPIAKGAIGDAFANLGQLDDALSFYEAAAKLKDNSFTTPLYLFKAANTALDLGESKKALGYFETIQKDYPKSKEATDIEVYINRAKYAE